MEKLYIKYYNSLLGSDFARLYLYVIYPLLAICIYCGLNAFGTDNDITAIMIGLIIYLTEVITDINSFNEIGVKNSRRLLYMRISPNGYKVLKGILTMDIVRRVLTIEIIVIVNCIAGAFINGYDSIKMTKNAMLYMLILMLAMEICFFCWRILKRGLAVTVFMLTVTGSIMVSVNHIFESIFRRYTYEIPVGVLIGMLIAIIIIAIVQRWLVLKRYRDGYYD